MDAHQLPALFGPGDLSTRTWADLEQQIRARRVCRVADASGVRLVSWASLAERFHGHISGWDARLCVIDPDRVAAADARREMAMFSRSIERYLGTVADHAGVIAAVEGHALPRMTAAWRTSRQRARVLRDLGAVAAAMRRAQRTGDLHAEYGAARRLADFAAGYEKALMAYCTAWSRRLVPAHPDRAA